MKTRNLIFQDLTMQGGVTLLEVMVVVAIIGIIAGLTVPNLNRILTRIRLSEAARGFAGTLIMARSEAIKRGTSYGVVIDKGSGCDAGNHCYHLTDGTNIYSPIDIPASIGWGGTWPVPAFPKPYQYITPVYCSVCGGNPTGTILFTSSGSTQDASFILSPRAATENWSGVVGVVVVGTSGIVKVVEP